MAKAPVEPQERRHGRSKRSYRIQIKNIIGIKFKL